MSRDTHLQLLVPLSRTSSLNWVTGVKLLVRHCSRNSVSVLPAWSEVNSGLEARPAMST